MLVGQTLYQLIQLPSSRTVAKMKTPELEYRSHRVPLCNISTSKEDRQSFTCVLYDLRSLGCSVMATENGVRHSS